MPEPKRKGYARGTKVTAAASKAEIEKLLTDYGATAFHTGWQNNPPAAAITFDIEGIRFRYLIPMPSSTDDEIRYTGINQSTQRRERTGAALESALEQARREKWRALFLSIKGQLVAVDEGIKTFAEAFLTEAVITNAPGQPTVRDWLRPQLLIAAAQHPAPPMLPGIRPEDL